MRTTVRLDEDLLNRAKRRAAEENRTLTSLIEEGIAIVLAGVRAGRPKRVTLPVSRSTGGLLPGVDLNDAAGLESVMGDAWSSRT
jgi:hypothetical protein